MKQYAKHCGEKMRQLSLRASGVGRVFRGARHEGRRSFALDRTAVMIVLLCASGGLSEESAAPFVAGFDRFARHGDVAPSVGGRLLLSELSCTACHRTSPQTIAPKRGPRLDGVGNRVRTDWLRRFLESPTAVKPGTTMPDVMASLPASERDRATSAIVAFLSTQKTSFPVIKATGANPVPHEFWQHGSVDRGARLYHQIGCVACHRVDKQFGEGGLKTTALDQLLDQLDPEEIAEMGLTAAARPIRSVPHGDLPAKYTRKSLTFFLLNPARVRPAGRMPSFQLTPSEAADISAYLIGEQKPVGASRSAGSDMSLVEKGREYFAELKCVNCHEAQGVTPKFFAKPLGEMDSDATQSCLTGGGKGAPRFSLDDVQIKAIHSAVADLDSRDSESSQAEFRMMQLNCYSCHPRNKLGGVGRTRQRYFETFGHIDLGDEGRLPPPLTGVGKKLTSAWLEKVLGGNGDLRPYMMARMPVFSKAAVAGLADQLSRADGGSRPAERDIFGDHSDLARDGRTLLNNGCVQCHGVRGESMPGVAGIDLTDVTRRIHPKWFHDFLLDPGKLKARTRMPTFFPQGKSASPNILNGDVERQVAAIWAYLKEVEKHPLPDKIAAARSRMYELVPKKRAILLRTFMRYAGPQAIAVGYPRKVHFAFDAEQVRLAQAWRGRFLDAYSTWFVRFAPPVDPLGVDVVQMPTGVPLALLKNDTQPWPDAERLGYRFQGFQLDGDGVPTFLYRFDRFKIEDRIVPSDHRGLNRRLTINIGGTDPPKESALWFRANAGAELKREIPFSNTNERNLTVVVSREQDRFGMVRRIAGKTEWLFPVAVDRTSTIEVEYRW